MFGLRLVHQNPLVSKTIVSLDGGVGVPLHCCDFELTVVGPGYRVDLYYFN